MSTNKLITVDSQLAIQESSEALLAKAEMFRRETPRMDTTPIPALAVDYSASGNVMENAMGHLRESIPNGQKLRTEFAFVALVMAVDVHRQWLRAKGYDV